MSRNLFTTLVVHNCPKYRQEAVSALSASSAEVVARASVSSARKYLLANKVSLLMVSTMLPECVSLCDEAIKVGLNVELLFQLDEKNPDSKVATAKPGHLYFCFTSLTSIKLTCFMLQALGCWWELQSGEASVHERYRKILNRVRQGIVEVGPEGIVRWANNAFKGLVGKGDNEGISATQLVSEEDIPCLQAVQTQLRSGIINPFMVRLREKGTLVEVDSTPRFGKNNEYLGSIGLVRQNESVQEEAFEASRNLSSLYSLALALSRAFDVSKIINIVTETVRNMCGYVCVGIKLQNHSEVVDKDLEVKLSPEMRQALDDFCERLGSQSIRVIKDMERDPDPCVEFVRKAGFKGLVAVPLTAGVRRIGCIWALAGNKTALAREKSSFLISVGVQAGMALQNALHVRQRLTEEANRRHFYRDALNALTSGKLVFCEYDELDQHWSECGQELTTLKLQEFSDVPLSRQVSEECMQAQGFSQERLFDMVTCVSEAATNVVKYGPPGKMVVRADESGIHVRLDDVGPGIAFANLPKAVLLSGYSTGTAPSLGLGYSVILELCDTVYLSTGEKGTSLILEMVHKVADPLDAFVGFAKVSA